MSGHRVSIRGLMTFIVLLSVIFASLHDPNDLWARSMLTLAFGVAGVALLGALLTRGERRATWAGIFVFGAGYLVLCFWPGFDSQVTPRLLTTSLADYQYTRMGYDPARDGESVWVERFADQVRTEFVEGRVFVTGNEPVGLFNVATGQTKSLYSSTKLRALSPDAFRQLCHADLSLLFALFGAAIARRIATLPGPATPPARGNDTVHETTGGDR